MTKKFPPLPLDELEKKTKDLLKKKDVPDGSKQIGLAYLEARKLFARPDLQADYAAIGFAKAVGEVIDTMHTRKPHTARKLREAIYKVIEEY